MDCGWSHRFGSSPEISLPVKDSRGAKTQEVNLRTMMAFREIGKGHEDMKTFTAFMNMPPPMHHKTYNELNSVLLDAYEKTATKSMENAAVETRQIENPTSLETDIVDCQVGIDGSWQKRGHSSLNGICAAIFKSTKKVIDYKVLTKFCRACAIWNSRKGKPNTQSYESFMATHQCAINHVQSSGAMETVSAISFFAESIPKYNLRYTHFIGDGDTNSYQKVTESKPYGDDCIPDKLECVGHVQKRLGTRMRKVVTDNKGKKLADGKPISGKGRLTKKAIDKMQNYFGMAIRQNSLAAWNGDKAKALYGMKKCILAVLWHCIAIEDPEVRHRYCPRSEDSWCKHWNNPDKESFKPSINLPVAVKDVLLKTFLDLSSDELLSRCLAGATQNPSEAFNQFVWKKCPKNIFVGRKV